MNSCIASIGAYERGSGPRGTCLHEQKMSFGRTGIVRPLAPNDLEATIRMNTEPIIGSLNSLMPVTLELVSQSNLEPLWDHLVSEYHYLGYRRLLGHRLKYLIFIQGRPVAALSWSAPALKLRVRDKFIGWSDEQRKTHLNRIANNSRFLILPWVRVSNLASHVLSINIGQLNKDWQQQFNKTLWLVETFVDPCRFKATSYRASNWKFVGLTHGCGKQGQGYFYHGAIKEVYVYVLEPHFRSIIGCQQKPYYPFHRPPSSLKKVEGLHMILRHAGWHPDIVPCMKLTEHDVEAMADELVKFHQQFHDCFGRIEHQRLGLTYLSGLMSNVKTKAVEPIALEFLGSDGVRGLQRFMKSYRWDQEAMEAKHQRQLSESISCPDGMINVDSSEFVKKGKESVGVARQYCGAVGKVENCQSGVFVGYSSEKGYGLLTCRLYMPRSWFAKEHEKRRKYNLVPEDLTFQTKPQIALDLISKVAGRNLFPAKWIGCDATFGSDSNFLESLPKGIHYFASVRSKTQVFLKKPKVGLPPYKGRGPRPKKIKVLPGQPQAQSVSKIAQSQKLTWETVILAEGAKGPVVAEVARLRVLLSNNKLPKGSPLWLFMRRMPDGQTKYALSNAPKRMPIPEMCKASTLRWPIEQSFGEGKGQIGMDHYEHRSWPAWHRHMTYVFLGLHFLLRLRLRFKKKSGFDATPSPPISSSGSTASLTESKRSYRNCEISHSSKLCCL
jgi:SRSO17 transposase